MSRNEPFGIYIHIPYCRSKCRYCDFYSAPGARGVPQAYVDALLRELAKSTRRPDTLYFGGGTPALLSPGQVSTCLLYTSLPCRLLFAASAQENMSS